MEASMERYRRVSGMRLKLISVIETLEEELDTLWYKETTPEEHLILNEESKNAAKELHEQWEADERRIEQNLRARIVERLKEYRAQYDPALSGPVDLNKMAAAVVDAAIRFVNETK